jgi:hypothetical protein
MKLTAADTAELDFFGWSVAIENERVLIAAPFDDDACPDDPSCQSGAAYLFALTPTPLMAGDANQDLTFDQLDIVQVSQGAKYLSGLAATWGEGDWDGAPGGAVGEPPGGNGFFDQQDIVASLQAGTYLTGPYAGLKGGGREGDGQTSLVYDAGTGELAVDAPAGSQLTSINIDSAARVFTGDAAQNLGGSFDHDADENIFKATFGSSFGSLSFGRVAQAGLAPEFLLQDLTVVGSLAGGGALGAVDLVYVPVPEPASGGLAVVGFLVLAAISRRHRTPRWGGLKR